MSLSQTLQGSGLAKLCSDPARLLNAVLPIVINLGYEAKQRINF